MVTRLFPLPLNRETNYIDILIIILQILLAKKLEQGPAFVVTFQAQQLTRKKKEGSIDDVSCPYN